jgi:sulfate transport system substrate-binding protein
MTRRSWSVLVAVVLVAGVSVAGFSGCGSESGAANAKGGKGTSLELLNVSYDPTRELWRDINDAFIPTYEKSNDVKLTIKQSHAGSATQARAIIDGLEADVATLSIWLDTEALHKKGLLKDGWETRLDNKSLAYTSTVVFVVRKGNPKGIKEWDDLVKGDVSIITPNPKTSGNGKLSLLAAWGDVLKRKKGTEEDAKKFLAELYQRVPVLDTGARGATTTFSQKGVGDVHLTMESEAFLEVEESKGELEVVYPSLSILHEPHVTVVDENVDRKGTRAAAEAYLKFLYTPQGQEIIAKHGFRPIDPEVLAKVGDKFPKIELFPLTDIVAGWDAAQEKFFAEGAIFDSIYHPTK